MHRISALLLVIAIATALGGCVTTATDALLLKHESTALRELQTRRFETTDEPMMLQASAALLQDLGFSLDNSESEVGLLVASKERTAVELVDVAQAIGASIVLTAAAIMVGVSHVDTSVPWDERQHMRVCLVTRPVEHNLLVRVTFQRIVWTNEGGISKREALQEPRYYAEFFERLSKAVFLEAHGL
jgi:hypothetical protein